MFRSGATTRLAIAGRARKRLSDQHRGLCERLFSRAFYNSSCERLDHKAADGECQEPNRRLEAERLDCSPPTKATRVQSPAGSLRIFASGNRAGRCRWSVIALVVVAESKASDYGEFTGAETPRDMRRYSHVPSERGGGSVQALAATIYFSSLELARVTALKVAEYLLYLASNWKP
ncbi:hypothetical protein PR048_029439 [Dryococelus australis]|uniref:Uncharacterized protein n=1 Tax=Dryococelus australis TaxID=614101 RepID=A0ABQ9GFU0_9NEOP|nr:hypothetical protein PR048_029439 [Dryococelus australis]